MSENVSISAIFIIRTVGTLRTKTLGDSALSVSKTGDLLLALLHDNAVQGLNIRAHNAAADGLPTTLTGAAHTVARVALTKEQANTLRQEDTLLHRETLLVVTTADAKDVALPLVTERVDLNVLRHALVVKAAHQTLVHELERLLRARGRVGDVDLHLYRKDVLVTKFFEASLC